MTNNVNVRAWKPGHLLTQTVLYGRRKENINKYSGAVQFRGNKQTNKQAKSFSLKTVFL